jgi:hypothetical protein
MREAEVDDGHAQQQAREQQRIDDVLSARDRQLDALREQQDHARRASDAFIDAALKERTQRQLEDAAKARLAIEAQREAGEHEAKAAAAKLLATLDMSAREIIKLGWHAAATTFLVQLYTPECVVCPDHDRVLLLVSRALTRQPGLEIARIDCVAMHALCYRIGVRAFPTLVVVSEGRVYFLPRAKGEDPDSVIEFATGRFVQQQSLPWPWADSMPSDSDVDEFDLIDRLIAANAAEVAAKLAPPTTTTTTTIPTTVPRKTPIINILDDFTDDDGDAAEPRHDHQRNRLSIRCCRNTRNSWSPTKTGSNWCYDGGTYFLRPLRMNSSLSKLSQNAGSRVTRNDLFTP